MPITTGTDLVEALRQHEILEPAQADGLLRDPRTAELDARTQARELIERGWLTPFQANQALTERGHELVLGSYVLMERLGAGGMGQVYKARHRDLGSVVALKVLRKECVEQHAETIKRFQREAKASSLVTHPNIVAAYETGEADGLHYMAMEYVEGTDLSKLLAKQGQLTAELACRYIRQAALGLQHAHEHGLVHRDIKPHNLILTNGEGVVKVLDMGLARLREGSGSGGGASLLTVEGSFLGTPDYVSPEQVLDPRRADIRSDVYSLGCTLYHLLAGNPPFAKGTAVQKVIWHQYAQPPALDSICPGLPKGLGPVVHKMMAKKPEDRYQRPGDVAAALAPFCGAEIAEQAWAALPEAIAVTDGDHTPAPANLEGDALERAGESATLVPGGKPRPGILVALRSLLRSAAAMFRLGPAVPPARPAEGEPPAPPGVENARR